MLLPLCSVIADTLSVSMGPQDLIHTEGDAMELTCKVSRSTAQHTHLSVGWYCLRGEHRAEILTLSKDFVVMPGPAYAQRFLAGNVRLDKVGSTSYKLSIAAVEPSDQGQLYCEAAEWIEDPDGTWKDISRKQSERTSLVVTPQGKALGSSCFVQQRTYSRWPLQWCVVKISLLMQLSLMPCFLLSDLHHGLGHPTGFLWMCQLGIKKDKALLGPLLDMEVHEAQGKMPTPWVSALPHSRVLLGPVLSGD